MLIGLYKDGKFYAVHTDHQGTPRLVTDPDNQPVWQWPYSAFGNNKPTGVVTLSKGANGQPTIKATEPAITLNLRFPGQYADAESGLHQNGWREYSARTGRYVQSDPIGLDGGIQRYTYVGGGPLASTDPSGLATKDPSRGSGPFHPPDGTSLGCTNADDCPEIERKMYLLQKMITSHEGWDRVNPKPRGGNRHAQEIADLWRALGKCQALWQRKDCDNCPPPPGFLDWVKNKFTPQQNQSYDSRTERWIPDLPGTSPVGPVPGLGSRFMLIP